MRVHLSIIENIFNKTMEKKVVNKGESIFLSLRVQAVLYNKTLILLT